MLTIIDTLMDTQRVEMRRECGESNMTGWIRLRPSNYSSPDIQERHWHELLVTDPRFWRDTCRCWMPEVGPITIVLLGLGLFACILNSDWFTKA